MFTLAFLVGGVKGCINYTYEPSHAMVKQTTKDYHCLFHPLFQFMRIVACTSIFCVGLIGILQNLVC